MEPDIATFEAAMIAVTNPKIHSRPADQGDPEESKAWLSGVITSIEEAGKHEGPLDGRKLLGDLEKAVTLLMLERVVPAAEARARAQLEARLRRKHDEIGRLATKLRIAESANVVLHANFEDLEQDRLREMQLKNQQIEALQKKAKSDAEKRDRDDRWVIHGARGRFFKAPGQGVTNKMAEAHRYTWIKAMETCKDDGDRVLHISDPEVTNA